LRAREGFPEKNLFVIEKKMKAGELLKELQLNPEGYPVLRDGELLNRDKVIAKGDEIEIDPVVSGGI